MKNKEQRACTSPYELPIGTSCTMQDIVQRLHDLETQTGYVHEFVVEPYDINKYGVSINSTLELVRDRNNTLMEQYRALYMAELESKINNQSQEEIKKFVKQCKEFEKKYKGKL